MKGASLYSPSSGAGPVLSPGFARGAVWVERGTTARSRVIEWRPGAAGVENLYLNSIKLKIQNHHLSLRLRITIPYLYNKDTRYTIHQSQQMYLPPH